MPCKPVIHVVAFSFRLLSSLRCLSRGVINQRSFIRAKALINTLHLTPALRPGLLMNDLRWASALNLSEGLLS